MLLVLILKIEIRAITGLLYLRGLHFRIVGATHYLGESDQVRFFSADHPIISVATERNDPMFGVRVFE